MVLAINALIFVIFLQFKVDSKSFGDGIKPTADVVEPAQVMIDGVGGFNDPIYGDHFQGDIELSPEQEEIFMANSSSKGSRTGIVDTRYRWPKNTQGQVIVPYYIFSWHFSEFL
jgi:hypothetical protein